MFTHYGVGVQKMVRGRGTARCFLFIKKVEAVEHPYVHEYLGLCILYTELSIWFSSAGRWGRLNCMNLCAHSFALALVLLLWLALFSRFIYQVPNYNYNYNYNYTYTYTYTYKYMWTRYTLRRIL